jgi:hypothetical protein
MRAPWAPFPKRASGPVRARGTDPDTVAQIAAKLLAAEYPVLITRYGGRNPAFPALVDELARFRRHPRLRGRRDLPQHSARFAVLPRRVGRRLPCRRPMSA